MGGLGGGAYQEAVVPSSSERRPSMLVIQPASEDGRTYRQTPVPAHWVPRRRTTSLVRNGFRRRRPSGLVSPKGVRSPTAHSHCVSGCVSGSSESRAESLACRQSFASTSLVGSLTSWRRRRRGRPSRGRRRRRRSASGPLHVQVIDSMEHPDRLTRHSAQTAGDLGRRSQFPVNH
jgi:hypothetical protein